MSSRATAVFALLLGAAVAAACAPAEDETDDAEGAASVASGEFWGDDRVGARLKNLAANDECKYPKSLADLETCFKIGRKCERRDSQEVFVVEENQARDLDSAGDHTREAMPRVVITGCNTGDKNDPATLENSYSLMTALFSPGGSTNGDTLLLTDNEVMALDKTTGLFNFYVFSEGSITRVFRDGGQVKERVFNTKTKTAGAATKSDGDRCFGCHVNGAPLMNELADPWTNWISFKKETSSNGALSGTTKELLDLAVPNAAKGTASLAGDLEQTLRAAHCKYVGGDGCKHGSSAAAMTPTKGFGHQILSGQLPGGPARLLKSVLCETELNYVSASESFPMELFFEPDATAAASPPRIATNGDTRFPFMLPVRSEVDKDIEIFLIGRRMLAPSISKAVRLVDDENDIFSKDRCALHAEITKTALPSEGFKINGRLRDAIVSHLDGPTAWAWTKDPKQAGRLHLMKALTGVVSPQEEDTARMEYMNEVQLRAKPLKAAMSNGGPLKDAAVKKANDRKAAARKMFNGGGPLPVLDE